MDSVILVEQLDGIPWIVAHNPATRHIAVRPAPPDWASPDLADAVTGSLRASVDGLCVRCEAVRPAADPDGAPYRMCTTPVPHAAWCPWSREAISRLEEACRPPGMRWIPDMRDEVTDRLAAYIADLTESLAGTLAGGRG